MSQLIRPTKPIINWQHPLTRGMLFHAPLNDGGGTTARDLVGKVDGAFASPGWKNDFNGRVASFNGSSSKITFPNPGFASVPNITISVRAVVPSDFDSHSGGECLFETWPSSNGQLRIFTANLGNLYCNIGGSGLISVALNTLPNLFTKEHRFTLVITGGTGVKLYYDYTLVVSNTSSQAASSATFILGNQNAVNWYSNVMSDVSYWKRAINIQELKQLCDNPFAIYRNVSSRRKAARPFSAR